MWKLPGHFIGLARLLPKAYAFHVAQIVSDDEMGGFSDDDLTVLLDALTVDRKSMITEESCAISSASSAVSSEGI